MPTLVGQQEKEEGDHPSPSSGSNRRPPPPRRNHLEARGDRRKERSDRDGGGLGRVVLLLDLDCFYAQCECVRLGFDGSTTSLALLQWNSVLAVTYPARENYKIKRGDGWEDVKTKSKGNCLAIHVPILTTAGAAAAAATSSDSGAGDGSSDNPAAAATSSPPPPATASSSSLASEYSSIFQMPESEQEKARSAELGVRRFSKEGKSCIERYRIASARIFETVREWIAAAVNGGGGGVSSLPSSSSIVLERASIDEFFLDVTEFCRNDDHPLFRGVGDDGSNNNEASSSSSRCVILEKTGTVVIGDRQDGGMREDDGDHRHQRQRLGEEEEDDDRASVLIARGCLVAHGIRKAVREKLGFTLSAGVSYNKTVAKLSASYGKPNGQAVCFPSQAAHLLSKTPIGKCRNLGGKFGARVEALLPVEAPKTVGSIARYLSLEELQRGLGGGDDGNRSTARWVYELAHGKDDEQVVSKTDSAALVKSITAFKSLNRTPHTLDESAPWIRLVAVEVVTRVERDAESHRRYPRSCNVQYKVAGDNSRHNKSARVSFPHERLSTQSKVDELVRVVPKLIQSKEGPSIRIDRVGLCAESFVTRAQQGHAINSYFSAAAAPAVAAPAAPVSSGGSCRVYGASDEKVPLVERQQIQQHRPSAVPPAVDKDLELAKRLQKEYDRETRIVQAVADAGTRGRSSYDSSTSGGNDSRKRRRPSSGQQPSQKGMTLFTQQHQHHHQQQQGQIEIQSSSAADDGEVEEEVNVGAVVGSEDAGDDVDATGQEAGDGGDAPDRDLALAKRLQKQYDREVSVSRAFNRRSSTSSSSQQHQQSQRRPQAAPKTRKIDTFFRKR